MKSKFLSLSCENLLNLLSIFLSDHLLKLPFIFVGVDKKLSFFVFKDLNKDNSFSVNDSFHFFIEFLEYD